MNLSAFLNATTRMHARARIVPHVPLATQEISVTHVGNMIIYGIKENPTTNALNA